MNNNSDITRREHLKLSGAVGALGAVGLAGCLDSDDGDADEITGWAWADPALEEFREQHADTLEDRSGTRLEWETFPWSEYQSNLVTAVGADRSPDVFQLSVLWTRQFADNDRAMNVEAEGVDTDQFTDAARRNSSYEGTLYAVPWYVDCRLLAINREWFRDEGLEVPDSTEAPTWDEFETWVETLSADDQVGCAIDPEAFDCMVYSNGGGYLTDDGTEAAINSPEAVEVGEFLQKHVAEEDNIMTRPGPELADEFIAETTPMYCRAGSWEYSRLEESGIDWQYVPIPVGPSGNRSRSWSAGVYFALPPDGDHTEEAMEFLDVVLSDEVQANTVANHGGFPAVESAYETDEFREFIDDNEKLEVVEQEMENTVSFPDHPETGEMWSIVHDAAERIFQDTQSPQESLDQAADEINDLL